MVKQILPRIINFVGGMKAIEPVRRRVCEGLAGDVVEIGFGSGLNIPFYPAAVTRVDAVEPADLAWKLADKRVTATSIPVQRSGLDGQSLPFADDSYDAALSTLTLCTIPDVAAALRRVAPGPQARGDPALRRARAGSRRGRTPLATPRRADTEAALRRMPPHPADRRPAETAGFTITEVDVFYEKSAPKFEGAYSLGIALSP